MEGPSEGQEVRTVFGSGDKREPDNNSKSQGLLDTERRVR